MKIIAIAAVAAGMLAAAGSASAAISDVEFLKANRCMGLADSGVATVDTAAMDAFIKTERRARSPYALERGRAEYDKGKREGKSVSADRRERLAAELNGPCQAYTATVARGG